MLGSVLFFFLVLAVLTPFFGHDSRDGYDWRAYDEALRARLGIAPVSRR